MELRRFLILLFFPLSVSAQQTFTEHLTRRVAGEGTVTLSQDAEIEALVNGVAARPSAVPSARQTPPNHSKKQNADDDSSSEESASEAQMHRTQAIGFRIQVYAGGNNRKSKSEAYRMGDMVRSYFDDVNVYTHFISPRWVCRVGDFKTREEAVEQLRKMRLTQKFNEASIVKSKIIVYY